MKRMTFPAPRRESVELAGGGYTTKQWTLQGVKDYLAIGGWFASGHHDFDSKATATAAFGKILEEEST